MKNNVLALIALPLMIPALPAAEPTADAARLRARAALALAFADVRPPSYPEQYAKAVREHKPLVVWVGQPVRHLGGCVCVGCDAFPGAGAEAVVVGVPTADGQLRRVDLPGKPTEATVRDVLKPPTAAVVWPMELRAGH